MNRWHVEIRGHIWLGRTDLAGSPIERYALILVIKLPTRIGQAALQVPLGGYLYIHGADDDQRIA